MNYITIIQSVLTAVLISTIFAVIHFVKKHISSLLELTTRVNKLDTGVTRLFTITDAHKGILKDIDNLTRVLCMRECREIKENIRELYSKYSALGSIPSAIVTQADALMADYRSIAPEGSKEPAYFQKLVDLKVEL